ncbi:hypothetical protein PRUPE_4G264900, partial [Prunus persica]
IDPDNLFSARLISVKFLQFLNCEGNSPTNPLFFSHSVSMLNKYPMVVGIFPDKELLLKSRKTNFLKWIQQSGSYPNMWSCCH